MNTMTLLIGLVLMMSLTASAYPSRYYSRPPNNYRYYQPEIDRMLGYYNPYYYMVAAPVQSRSLMSDDYYYQDPYQVSQLNDMFSDYILGQLSKSKGHQRQGVEMRTKANSKNGISRSGSIPGAFLVPAKVNGAFAGPLAVVPAHYGGPGAVTNSAATGAQYLPIIDGPNWPFLGRPKVVSSFAVDPQSYSSAGGAQYVPVPDGPNWPYIGVASPIAESRSSRPSKDYDQHLIDDESYFPNIDYPFNYYPDDEYLHGNY